MQPIGDVVKVRIPTNIANEFGLGTVKDEYQSGVVVEMPDKFNFFGFHSFCFEASFMEEEKLTKLHQYYSNKLMGKQVYWKSLADRGMVFKEDNGKFGFIKITDIIAVGEVNDNSYNVYDNSPGAFKTNE